MGGNIASGTSSAGVGGGSAPPAPQGRANPGARGGSVPVLPQGSREPGRCPAGPWPGGPQEGAGSWEGGPRARGAGALRPSAGATVPPPAAGGRSCPSSASPRRDRSSRTGKSAGNASLEPPWPLHPHPSRCPVLTPSPPNCSSPALPGSARGRAIFIPQFSIWHRGKARVPALAAAAAATSGSQCHRSADHRGEPGWSRALC